MAAIFNLQDQKTCTKNNPQNTYFSLDSNTQYGDGSHHIVSLGMHASLTHWSQDWKLGSLKICKCRGAPWYLDKLHGWEGKA